MTGLSDTCADVYLDALTIFVALLKTHSLSLSLKKKNLIVDERLRDTL